MNTVNRLAAWLFGTTILILTLLFLWPSTGWLIRAQLGAPSWTWGEVGSMRYDNDTSIHSAAPTSKLPADADYETCLVDALRTTHTAGESGSHAVKSLWAMVPRFGNEPSLYAHILRFYTFGAVLLNTKENPLESEGAHPIDPSRGISGPEDLAGFDRAAAAGERIDPTNAYFPFMRAAGFLAGHREGEALQELQRANGAVTWNDYIAQEALAYEHTGAKTADHPSALGMMAVYSETLLPHYNVCRSAARFLTYKAVQAEAAGHPEEGLTIRHAVMKVGSLMRRDSTMLIGNLVGAALTTIAAARPGGSPAVKSITEAQKEAYRQKYYAYLRSIGHAEEAQWAEREITASDQVRKIASKWSNVSPYETGVDWDLMVHWLISLALLANAIWLLVLAGVSTVWRPQGRRKTFLAGLASSVALLTAAAWESRWVDCIYTFGRWLASEDSLVVTLLGLKFICLVLSLVMPFLLVIAATIYGSLSEKPGGAIVRALQAAAPLLTCLLLLAYAGMVISTARLEASVGADLRRMAVHEGQFLAEKTHQAWPGP